MFERFAPELAPAMSTSDPTKPPVPTKTRKKTRFYILLGIPLSILIVAPILTVVIQIRQRQYRAALMDKAVAARERGDAEKAQFFLDLFLQQQPGELNAVIMKGELLADEAKTPEQQQV